jgi:hypothetical protein
MKIKSFPLILAAVILPFMLLLVSSCDKKDEPNDQKTLRIKQLINEFIEETPFSISSDTLHFEYNDKNQLIAVRVDKYQQSYNFEYNPDGTISEAEYNADEEQSITTFFAWSGNKVTVTESLSTKRKTVFEVNAEKEILREEYYFLDQEKWIMFYYTINNWHNGNLISTEAWRSTDYQNSKNPEKGRSPFLFNSIWESFDNNAFEGNAKADFFKHASQSHTYDDKINPFKDVPMFRWSEGHTFTSENNILSTTSYSYYLTGSIEDSSIVKCSYSYNAENYPLIRSEVHPQYTYNQIFQYE